MAPLVAGIVSMLIQNNLPKVAQAVVDKGLDYVQEKTGVKLTPEPTPQELETLRAAAMQHEEFQITEANKDRAGARAMAIAALGQDDVFSKRFVMYLTIGWSSIAALYIFLITFMTIPQNNQRFADTILGFLLGTVIASFIQFWVGSSFGSRIKDLVKGA